MRVALLLLALLLSGCAASDPGPAAPPDAIPADLRLASPAFQDGGAIPKESSCDGAGTSPTLRISGIPPETLEVALTVVDPDVPIPQAPQQNFTHWTMWRLIPAPNGTLEVPAGKAPEGALQGQNSGGSQGWTAPCPPQFSTEHRYVFTAYALRTPVRLDAGATRAQLEAAMQGKVVAKATLTGTYARQVLLVTPP